MPAQIVTQVFDVYNWQPAAVLDVQLHYLGDGQHANDSLASGCVRARPSSRARLGHSAWSAFEIVVARCARVLV